ncbi:putative SOS response associated peptidase (SRAP) [Helianthus annuus]|uniref:Putative embryonic stem cell-specific 5-hydroxymethylcytosine-binding protein n=1 Tax=Helianthus annuus TaxID=4232 RepID=A0A251VNW5_HELAN|nr:abasic site processing protein YoqW [Helianthus annuus]KAF5820653.1 putative SOS response associated peptidase (SRAP) [Helianthus annuus]
MCGRCRCSIRPDDVPRACNIGNRPVRFVHTDRFRAAYNVSPGSNIPVVRRDTEADGQGAVVQCMKWGLIPSFTKKTEKPDYYRMFNARSESIGEKASFRRLLSGNRCLVAVEGFYEWKKDGSKKQPYYIHLKDDRPLVFAALYDSWKNSEGEVQYTFTILTTSSSSALGWLHDRMPVILGNKESTDEWLDGSSSSKFDSLLKPYEEPDLVWYPVTPAMGKPSFDGPDCIKEVKIEETKPISMFFAKKVTKKEDPSEHQLPAAHKEVTETEKPKGPKEEPETYVGPSTLNLKREYGDFSSDIKPPVNEDADNQYKSPAKKGNFKSPGDKQKTLFSYFGKG